MLAWPTKSLMNLLCQCRAGPSKCNVAIEIFRLLEVPSISNNELHLKIYLSTSSPQKWGNSTLLNLVLTIVGGSLILFSPSRAPFPTLSMFGHRSSIFAVILAMMRSSQCWASCAHRSLRSRANSWKSELIFFFMCFLNLANLVCLAITRRGHCSDTNCYLSIRNWA